MASTTAAAATSSKGGFMTVTPPLTFDTHHEDIIHDVQLDYYGKRLATASSDRTVKIFEVEPNKPERLSATLTGHESPVWQVVWAHPKFGSLLASCSYDGTVIVWKEQQQQQTATNQPLPQQQFGLPPAAASAAAAKSTWTRVKEYRGHEASVNSIAWAPAEFGLVLACASSDGRVSVLTYQADQQQQQQLQPSPLWKVHVIEAHQIGCNAVSWSPSAIPESLFGANSPTSATAAEASSPSIWAIPRLATAGCDNLIKIWKLDPAADKWVLDGPALEGHSDWVRDVAWAPNIGLSASVTTHMIASCSQDKTVRIWKAITTTEGSTTWNSTLLTPRDPTFFGDVVWRVSWSGSGNLLAVSCGDNHVTLWRETLEGEWECVSNIDQGTLGK